MAAKFSWQNEVLCPRVAIPNRANREPYTKKPKLPPVGFRATGVFIQLGGGVADLMKTSSHLETWVARSGLSGITLGLVGVHRICGRFNGLGLQSL